MNETKEMMEAIEQMPAPQTMNYDQKLVVSDRFVSDMYTALDSFSYVEVSEIFKTVEALKNEMPINVLNEIIRRIASFPYKNVRDLMLQVETDQSVYWTLIEPLKTNTNE